MKPFRPQVFLFRLLAMIFLWEALLLGYSFWACAHPGNQIDKGVLLTERCPRLGQRAENIFEIAIATTLSLLAGGTQLSQWSSSSRARDGSASQPLQLQQPPLEPSASPSPRSVVLPPEEQGPEA